MYQQPIKFILMRHNDGFLSLSLSLSGVMQLLLNWHEINIRNSKYVIFACFPLIYKISGSN
jgi:hypothetical protein